MRPEDERWEYAFVAVADEITELRKCRRGQRQPGFRPPPGDSWELYLTCAARHLVTRARLADAQARIRELEAEVERLTEPGAPICEVHCPCCGAALEIVQGEEEGEGPAVYGTPKPHPAAVEQPK
jgi:hypothetical protein